MPGNKYLVRNGSIFEEKNSPASSADSPAAGDIPALTTGGVLDTSLINSTVSSAGSVDSGKAVLLDGSGRIDSTVLPSGIGADTALIEASENISAGDFVNVHNVSGTAKIRKADASSSGKEAHGFVLSAVTSGNNGTVYFEGTNTQVTSQTPGVVYLSPSTAGLATATIPSTAGHVVQRLGVAVSATSIKFEAESPIKLA
jgi:hypothetical protein